MRFDLRTISKSDLIRKLSGLERTAGKQFLQRNKDNSLTATPLVLTSAPVSTTHVQGMAQLDRTIAVVVNDINEATKSRPVSTKGGKMASNITGASTLSAQFKNALAGVKAKINQANDTMTKAVTEMNTTADTATQLATQVQAEADDLKASLGQLTNFPPE